MNYKSLGNQFFDELVEKAKSYLKVKKVILFGSFARGDARAKSDIDLAFDFEDGDWLKFKEWVEEHFRTLRQVDLIDMKEAERDFLNSIHSEGVVLYERKN